MVLSNHECSSGNFDPTWKEALASRSFTSLCMCSCTKQSDLWSPVTSLAGGAGSRGMCAWGQRLVLNQVWLQGRRANALCWAHIEALAGQFASLWLPDVPPCSEPRCLGGRLSHTTFAHATLSHTTLLHATFSHTTRSHSYSYSYTTISQLPHTQLLHTQLLHPHTSQRSHAHTHTQLFHIFLKSTFVRIDAPPPPLSFLPSPSRFKFCCWLLKEVDFWGYPVLYLGVGRWVSLFVQWPRWPRNCRLSTVHFGGRRTLLRTRPWWRWLSHRRTGRKMLNQRLKDVETCFVSCVDTMESTLESAYNVRTHIIYWQELRTGDVANEDVRQLCIWNTTARTPESNQLDWTEEGRDQLCFKHVRDLQNKTCFNMCQEESSKRSFLLRALLAFGLCICFLLGACVARWTKALLARCLRQRGAWGVQCRGSVGFGSFGFWSFWNLDASEFTVFECSCFTKMLTHRCSSSALAVRDACYLICTWYLYIYICAREICI